MSANTLCVSILPLTAASISDWLPIVGFAVGVLFVLGAKKFGAKFARGSNWLGVLSAYPDGKRVRRFTLADAVVFFTVVACVGGVCIWALFHFSSIP